LFVDIDPPPLVALYAEYPLARGPMRTQLRTLRAEGLMVEFGILGPFEVLLDGESVTLGGPRQRAVLVRLLLEPGCTVSAERIIEDVWDGRPPRSAAKTLQKYVSELRRLVPGLELRTTGGGYALDVPPGALDASRFAEMVDRGRYRDALRLWRGPVLPDLPDLAFLTPERTRLEELRLYAIESRLEQDLEAGQHAPVASELGELVDAHPLRDRLARLLMLALYRSGRQVEALRAYERHRLALAELGVEPAVSTRELEAAILRHDPSLETPATSRPGRVTSPRRGRPAIALTSFVGRARELEDAKRVITANRLVTFTGPGGVGKTRLALEVASRVADRFPGGVWTVDLAGVDGSDIVTTLGSALEIDVSHGHPEDLAAIVSAVARWPPSLIIIDNCEHLVDCAAPFVDALLRGTRDVRMVATSRRPLGVDGEFVRPVPPLAVDDAALLFTDRARLTGAGEEDVSGAHATEICTRLDGLPLAIELAASQLRVISAQDLVARLDDHLGFRAPARGGSSSHRTLNDMVAWSYAHLPQTAQLTFARLGVFASSLTLPAAERVAASALVPSHGVFDEITTLIDHSLLARERRSVNGSRFRLLETLRLFALDRLAELGEEPSARRAHAEYYLELSAQSRTALYGPHECTWRDRLEIEEPNLHAALAWAATNEPVLALQLAVAMWPYWELRWRDRFGLAYIDRLLEREIDVPAAVRAWALTAAAAMGSNAGEAGPTTSRAVAAVAAHRASGDDLGLAEALAALGMALGNEERLEEAGAALADGLGVARRIGDLHVTARLLDRAGFVAGRRGDDARAAELHHDELAAMVELGSQRGEATALRHLAISRQRLGDLNEATVLCNRALEIWTQLDDLAGRAHVLTTLADIARLSGDLDGAEHISGEALVGLTAIGDVPCRAATYDNLATIAASRGQHDRAARLRQDASRLRSELLHDPA
jgi:predicted ATPase/DNA-binding SARP family transcriptional activator